MTPTYYGTDPRFVTPERRKELLAERFIPWPNPAWWSRGQEIREHWADISIAHCGQLGRGFVSNSRFASSATEQVIPRSNRAKQRKERA